MLQMKQLKKGSMCNRAIIIISDRMGETMEDVFAKYNLPPKQVNRIVIGYRLILTQTDILIIVLYTLVYISSLYICSPLIIITPTFIHISTSGYLHIYICYDKA